MKIVISDNISTGEFKHGWVRNAVLGRFKDSFVANGELYPYDGTEHLLATGIKRIYGLITPTVTAQIDAEIARITGKSEKIERIQIMAMDPTKPVYIQVIFPLKNGIHQTPYTIGDAFSRAEQEPEFKVVLGALLADLARIAGCTVQA